MATYYIDPSAATNGSGTEESPYNTLSGVTPADNDVFLFKCNTTYLGSLETTHLAANNLMFGNYGTGEKPILTSLVIPSWTQNSTYSTVYEYSLGSNLGGNVSENGVPLQCVIWTTNLATTFATMTPGSYTYDATTFTYYVLPNKPFEFSNYAISTILYGAYSTSAFTGLTVTGLHFKGFSRHGIVLLNRNDVNVNNCQFTLLGGNSSSGTYVGNGIECSSGCTGGLIYSNVFTYIFDSPITTQIYSNSGTVKNYKIYNNVINDGGLYGIEITVAGGSVTNATISNIEVYNNIVRNIGYNFRPKNVTGRGIHVGGNQATSTLNGIVIRNNIVTNCRWGLSDSAGATANILFSNNIVTTTQTPTNGRGIYTSGSVTYLGNIIKGYFYGVGSYGTVTGRTGKVYNCVITDAEEAIQQDANTGTLEIKNCVVWSNSRLVRIAVSGLTTTFQYNYWKSGITNGGVTVDGTNTQVSSFPLTTTFTLPVNSALKWTGVNLGYSTYHNPPSIGALEFIPERATSPTRGIR